MYKNNKRKRKRVLPKFSRSYPPPPSLGGGGGRKKYFFLKKIFLNFGRDLPKFFCQMLCLRRSDKFFGGGEGYLQIYIYIYLYRVLWVLWRSVRLKIYIIYLKLRFALGFYVYKKLRGSGGLQRIWSLPKFKNIFLKKNIFFFLPPNPPPKEGGGG